MACVTWVKTFAILRHSHHSDVGHLPLLARLSGTLCPRTCVIRMFLRTVTGSHWRRFYFRSTSVFSALEVFYENVLYKFTFDIWYAWSQACRGWWFDELSHWTSCIVLLVKMMRCWTSWLAWSRGCRQNAVVWKQTSVVIRSVLLCTRIVLLFACSLLAQDLIQAFYQSFTCRSFACDWSTVVQQVTI